MMHWSFYFCHQLSFQEWTQQMRDMLEARKRGDFAFRDKDFKTAIECYSQVLLCDMVKDLELRQKTNSKQRSRHKAFRKENLVP